MNTTGLKQKQDGFTIVELFILVIVLGILAALIMTTYTDIRQKDRNKERQQDIKALQIGVEGYYTQNGKYPTLTQLNSPEWRKKNLKTLKTDDLQDPKSTTALLVAAPIANTYSYAVVADNNTPCDNVTVDCAKYSLVASFEGGDNFEKTNLN